MFLTANLIRETRKAMGLTQAELARRLRTTQSAIARLESPDANPTVETLERVIAATGRQLKLEASAEPPQVDELQIWGNMRLTPAQRLDLYVANHRNMKEFLESVGEPNAGMA